MNAADVVLEYVRVLAWPAVAAGVLIGYRRSAQQLLGRLSKVDAGAVSATFDKTTAQAAEITHSTTATVPAVEVRSSLADSIRIKPHTFVEARVIGQHYRAGTPVLLDLTALTDADAKRLVDFSAGLTLYAGGTMNRIDSRVFLLEHARKTTDSER